MDKIIVLLATLALGGCDSPIEHYQGDPVDVLTSGFWDWDGADDFCNANPHSIRVSDDKKSLSVEFHDGRSGLIVAETRYTINSIIGPVLSTDMDGEDRTDEHGNFVSWDLIVNSTDQYCWRRSDWSETRCSASRLRCEL